MTSPPKEPSFSIFHLEAGIAMYHCSATSYAETDWPAILRLYDAMLTIHRSPVYLLNRAIVVAEIAGPHAGIKALERMTEQHGPPTLPPVRCNAGRALPSGRRSRQARDITSKPPGKRPARSRPCGHRSSTRRLLKSSVRRTTSLRPGACLSEGTEKPCRPSHDRCSRTANR